MYRIAPGVVMEALGESWAVFSPASGETLLLNAEAAAVLEVLQDGARDSGQVCAVLAEESGCSVDTLSNSLRDLWPQLSTAGLIEASNGIDLYKP